MPVGKGWFTILDYTQRYNLSIPGATHRCRSLFRKGILSMHKGTNKATQRTTVWYRVKG